MVQFARAGSLGASGVDRQGKMHHTARGMFLRNHASMTVRQWAKVQIAARLLADSSETIGFHMLLLLQISAHNKLKLRYMI